MTVRALHIVLLSSLLLAFSALANDRTAVKPTEEWLSFEDVVVTDTAVPLILRTGYERPVIFPEPVTQVSQTQLPGTPISIHSDIALFAPGQRFESILVEFEGLISGRRYRFDVSSHSSGKRIPVRLVIR